MCYFELLEQRYGAKGAKRSKGVIFIFTTMLHLGQNIRLIREAAGKTQAEFGRIVGANETKIKSYELERAKPKSVFLARIAQFAGISIKDLTDKVLSEKDIKIDVQNGENVLRGTFEGKPASAWENITESNRMLAQAQLKLAEGYERLLNMLETNLAASGSASLPVEDSEKGKSQDQPAQLLSGRKKSQKVHAK